MALLDIQIPQMGEGLQEVVIVGLQKKPGDYIKRDELIYSMETDKAVMEVESPYEGILKEWLADEGAVLPIGAPIARIETNAEALSAADAAPTEAGVATQAAPAVSRPVSRHASDVQIPPRTRAYSKEKGLTEDELHAIPAPSGKLMPADIDAYLAAKSAPTPAVETPVSPRPASADYTETPLSQQQRIFVSRIRRSAQLVIPGTMKRSMDWGIIRKRVEDLRAEDFTFRPTDFQTFAYCVGQAAKKHPKFRSTLVGDENVREHHHLNLGIAVARSNGELVTAVVPRSDALDYRDFIETAQERIGTARTGQDQADASTQLLLTYMGAYDILDATPVLVAPAIAVLFIGAAYEQNGRTLANLALTFDHRLINGVEGAEFLKTIVETVKQIEEII